MRNLKLRVVLKEGAGVLLLPNKEYGNTLKWGQVEHPVPKTPEIHAIPAHIIKNNVPNEIKME